MNGRIQTFLNHNEGEGRPAGGSDLDRNGRQRLHGLELRGGGIENGNDGVLPVYDNGASATPTDQGLVREMRIRSGFTGNVLGFGIRKKLSEQTEILGYTAVTVGIDSVARRKFTLVHPDWRESFVRVTSFWGSFTAGRTLTLFSRGATEITYLYGYRYGLGFPGTISGFSQSTAGSVGFGVLGNGFGAGLVYATPVMGGLQISSGLRRRRLSEHRPSQPRALAPHRGRDDVRALVWRDRLCQAVRERRLSAALRPQLLKSQLRRLRHGVRRAVRDRPVQDRPRRPLGQGRRRDVFARAPPVRLFRPADVTSPGREGPRLPQLQRGEHLSLSARQDANGRRAYVQTQVAAHRKLDLRAGFGVTRVHQLPEDKVQNWRTIDDPANPGTNILDPSTSVGYVTIRQQIGIGAGMTIHIADNFHFTLEYFRAVFQWYKPTPAAPGTPYPQQAINSINAGVTYDF